MSSTYLPPKGFIAEVKAGGVTRDSFNKVRIMGLNEFVYCKITLKTGEEIWTRLPKGDAVLLMELKPISVPAIWINEGEELMKINELLKKCEMKNASTSK